MAEERDEAAAREERLCEVIGAYYAAAEAGREPDALRIVVRGVVSLGEELRGRAGSRRPLTGSAEAIRHDLAALQGAGVTEVFLDLNFNPAVGSPDADPAASRATADEVLETFRPR
jgi:hypothetical protein